MFNYVLNYIIKSTNLTSELKDIIYNDSNNKIVLVVYIQFQFSYSYSNVMNLFSTYTIFKIFQK